MARSTSPKNKRSAKTKAAEVIEELVPEAETESEGVADKPLELTADDRADFVEGGEDSDLVEEPPAESVDELGSPSAKPRGVFVPALIGGVVAVFLMGSAAYVAERMGYLTIGKLTDAFDVEFAELRNEISDLKAAADAQAAELRAGIPDVAPITEATTALSEEIATLRGDAETTHTELLDRLNKVETQPIPEAELPAAVVEAYDAKLAEVDARIDERFGEVAATIDERLAAINSAETAAEETRENAQIAAARARAAAALARIDTAMQNGAPMADDLAEVIGHLGGEKPDALTSIADSGVPTHEQLVQDFPVVARAAIAAATKAAADSGEMSPVAAFFRVQLGARSLEPREGDSADAVLSRVEAALKSGNLDKALKENADLPEAARSVLAPWIRNAEARRDALADLKALKTQFEAAEG